MTRKIFKWDLAVTLIMVLLAGAALVSSVIDFVRGRFGNSLLEAIAVIVLAGTVWMVYRPQIKVILGRK